MISKYGKIKVLKTLPFKINSGTDKRNIKNSLKRLNCKITFKMFINNNCQKKNFKYKKYKKLILYKLMTSLKFYYYKYVKQSTDLFKIFHHLL